jgi:peptidoglycan hydrolase-like protein with peptidoglycan-binding domain
MIASRWRLAGGGGLLLAALAACAVAVGPVADADAAGRANVAALQVALRANGLYSDTVDGIFGPGTRRAVRAFQRRRGLGADGVPGPRTMRALGRRGRPRLGRRTIRVGARGFDVTALQFRLAWRGFPSGPFDGGYGQRTASALRRFQRWAGLTADGIAGPGTIRALRGRIRSSPVWLARPVSGPVSDRFGPRGNRSPPATGPRSAPPARDASSSPATTQAATATRSWSRTATARPRTTPTFPASRCPAAAS